MTRDQVLLIQRRVAAAGQDVGPVDGIYGAQTLAGQLGYVAGRQLGALGALLARALIVDWRKHALTTPLRMAHFTAQACHETGGFRHLVELGSGDGPDADPWDDYLERYDFRRDLGNNAGGMGELYRGRGIFQLTGAANYRVMSERLGINLYRYPARAAEPEIASAVACIYWSDRKLNRAADNDDELAITRAINGGTNGRADRRARLARAKHAWAIAA